MNLVTPFAQRFQVLVSVVISVFVLMVNKQESLRTAALASTLSLAPVGLDASSPHRITFCRVVMLSAYCRVVALPGAVAANLSSTLRDLVGLTAKLACKSGAILVPASCLFAVRSIAAFYRAKHPLASSKSKSTSAFHISIIPMNAAKAEA